MRRLRDLVASALSRFSRRASESRIDRELQFHIDMETERLKRELALDDLEARRRALVTFGGVQQHRETLRDGVGLPWSSNIEVLRQDTALALRLFRRSPRFFAAAILTLAVGIGANGAVFSILQSTLFHRLPYRDPAELVMLGSKKAKPGPAGLQSTRAMTPAMVLAWRYSGTSSIGDVAALLTRAGDLNQGAYASQLDIDRGDRVVRLNGALATPNFFTLLGVPAERGRVFLDSDESGGQSLVLLSDALWRREFAADTALIGKAIPVTFGRPRVTRTLTVAGILPAGFHFTYPDEIEAWVVMPWSDVEAFQPSVVGFSAVARLRPGLSLESAQRRAAELSFGDGRMDSAVPREERTVIGLQSMHDWVVGNVRPSLQLLGAVAVLLLLTTCITVSNGLLARVAERQQELAVRTALGADTSRLVRQLLTEGILLSITGALVGSVLAIGLQPPLRALLPASIPRVGDISIDPTIIVFGAVMAAFTTIVAALVPAWGGTRFDAIGTLTRAAGSGSASKAAMQWRQALIATQASVATVLLICATLLLMSFWRLGLVPLGFDGNKVAVMDVRLLNPARYRQSFAIPQFQSDLLARVSAVPGIEAVGLASAVPFTGFDRPIGITRPEVGTQIIVRERVVDPGYFSVLRIPIVRGRGLTQTDRAESTPVTVISESYARSAFGSEDPIGKMIGSDPALEVVGVVGDTRYAGLEQDPTPAIYINREQQTRPLFDIVFRTDANTSLAAVTPAVRQIVHELDPTLPTMKFQTIDRIIDASVANRRFYTVATVAFAAIALFLTIAGMAIIVARVVAERRQEFAIRSALGATTGVLIRVAARDAMLAVGIGVAVGLLGAYIGAITLTQFLFQVSPRSPVTYATVGMLVLGVAVLAALAPMRRFERTSLSTMLRAE